MAGRPRLPGVQPREKSIVTWTETSLCDQVDVVARQKDVSRSWIVRQALAEYLAHEARRSSRGATWSPEA
jgi:predicted transcriptional regulator